MAAMTVPAISSSSSLSISIGEYLGFSDTRQIFGLSSNLLQVYEPSIAAMTISVPDVIPLIGLFLN